MSLMIDELIKEVTKRIEASEGRSRSRKSEDQQRFDHATHVLLTDLWKAVMSTPIRECSINKRSGWYSKSPSYRALPVHDSFILHHAYGEGGEVEEAMRRAFYEEVGEPISKIDKEILTWAYRKDEEDTGRPTTLELDTILSGDDDVSHWRERHQLWYAQR